MPVRRALACSVLAVLLVGCTSTQQIETAPPKPFPTEAPPQDARSVRAALSVVLNTGETPLPDGVQALRFRIAEVHLKPHAGGWAVYPADLNTFEVHRGQPVRKSVLRTRVEPTSYDSLALVLDDVFVLYDENAGGPLTLPRDTPTRLALPFEPSVSTQTTLRLSLEPGASLSRDAACRWHFVPFVRAAVE